MTAYGINSVIQKVWPDWTVVGIIGSGAYGEVYRAERLNGRVYSHSAIKVISIPRNRSEIDSLTSSSQVIIDQAKKDYEDVANGFADEIKLMESLKGTSNIVNIEDFKISLNEDGLSWTILIRMELLDPVQLDAKYSEEEIIELGIDICSALETCAKVGVIHRDIKPSNILINSFGSFKLGDFGIAKAMNQASFRMTTGKGTPNFMAPEVAQNGNYGIHGVRVDIYSLGQVLYYYLNRCRGPFIPLDKQLLSYKDRAEAYSRRMGGEALPAPIDASKEMAHLVLKACAFKPEDRFADATEMKAALNAIKSGTYVLPKEKKKKLSFKSSSVSSSIVAETETTDQVITNEVIDLDKTLTTAQPINDKKPKASKMRSKEIVKNRRDEKTQDSVKVENATIETELTETVLAIDPDKTTAVKRHNDIKSQEAESKPESKIWRIVVALLAILILIFGCVAVYNILKYTGTVEEISIAKLPIKTTYECSEILDTTGLELAVDYSLGKDKNVTSGFICAPTHLSASGTQQITVFYHGKTATFNVTVLAPTVTSVTVRNNPTKTVYNVGDTLDTSGLELNVEFSDGSTNTVSSNITCLPAVLSKAGTQQITVSFWGETTTFDVTVNEIAVSSISVAEMPDNTVYEVGDKLNVYGMKIQVNYSDGTSKAFGSDFNKQGFSFSPTKLSTAGTQKITVTYGGKTAIFYVTVKEPTISSISVTSSPAKTTYNVGDTLNTSGLKLNAKYSDGTTKTISSGFTCSPTTLSTAGTQKITVTYGGKTTSFNVTVKEQIVITSIGVWSMPSKTTYNIGDTLDTAGFKVVVYYTDGSAKTISSGFTCSPTKLSTAGTQKITVAYNGKYTSFDVEVKSKATTTNTSTVSKGTCGQNLAWKLTSDGTLTISGAGKMTDYSYDNLAPWYDDRSSIKSVIIEEGVTSIGDYTFYYCHSLTSVAIPDSVKSIGFNAFSECSNLTAITIPDGVNTISSNAFQHSKSLNSINVSSNNRYYTSIDGVLFNKAKTELVTYPIGKANVSYLIPNGVTSIGDHAFAFCSNLTNVTIPDSVTSIDDGAFWDCSSMINIFVSSDNRYYASVDGALFNKSKTELIRYPEGKTNTSYTIPDSVTSIGFNAFSGCSNLTNVTIPDSVTSINRYAFRSCLKIKNITIPTSVASIDYYAFLYWGSDQTIYIKGRTSAPLGWNALWAEYCDAKIVWDS